MNLRNRWKSVSEYKQQVDKNPIGRVECEERSLISFDAVSLTFAI